MKTCRCHTGHSSCATLKIRTLLVQSANINTSERTSNQADKINAYCTQKADEHGISKACGLNCMSSRPLPSRLLSDVVKQLDCRIMTRAPRHTCAVTTGSWCQWSVVHRQQRRRIQPGVRSYVALGPPILTSTRVASRARRVQPLPPRNAQ